MKTVFFRMALVLAFMGVFIGGVLASDTVRQPVPLEDQRFNGVFYYRSDLLYRFWEFDGTSMVVINTPARNYTSVWEFRIYENGLIRSRHWYLENSRWSDDPVLVSLVGYISGPYAFLFNGDNTKLQIGWRIGPDNIFWRTYTRR